MAGASVGRMLLWTYLDEPTSPEFECDELESGGFTRCETRCEIQTGITLGGEVGVDRSGGSSR